MKAVVIWSRSQIPMYTLNRCTKDWSGHLTIEKRNTRLLSFVMREPP